MQERIRADGKIQVLRLRFHGSSNLGGNNTEQVAELIIDRTAAVSGADRRRNLQHIIAGRARNNAIAYRKIQPFRMADDKDPLAHLDAAIGGHGLRKFSVTKMPLQPEKRNIEPLMAADDLR